MLQTTGEMIIGENARSIRKTGQLINRNMKVYLIDNITRQLQIKAKTSIASNHNLVRKSHILLYMLSTNHRLTYGPRPDVHGEPAPSCSSSTRVKSPLNYRKDGANNVL